MTFVSVCILANDKHCLITGHIHIDYLPNHCLVALWLVSDSQYLQNQALNDTSQVGQMSPGMSHDPGSLLSKDHSSVLIGRSGLKALVPTEKPMHGNPERRGRGSERCRAALVNTALASGGSGREMAP